MLTSLTPILINTAGGLGIFLLGMSQLSEGLQAIAGNRLRKIVAVATTNRLAGITTGIVTTCITQSSSVVTVMIVGMVTAGVMTLRQAINVIVGSNIGSTCTAWIVAVMPSKLGDHCMVMIAVSVLVYLFSKKERMRYIGLVCLGLGLVFFGLDLMNKGLTPLQSAPEFVDAFKIFEASSFRGVLKCTLVGIVVTGIIQSSAAAAAISLTLAYNCVISFETASALVFGMNIGTTVTAWLAALNASTEARRAALAHTLFNCIGVLLLAPLFLPVFVPAMHRLYPSMNEVVNGVMPHVTAPIAFFHTVFNVVTTLFFLPFLAPFAALVRRLIPGKEFTERPRLTMLEPKKMSPGIAVEQAKQEVVQMATTARQMLADFRLILTGQGKPELEAGIFEAEAALDVTQHEVSDFLGKVMSAHLPTDVAYRARMLLRVADEYESVSDEIQALLKMMLRMRKNEMALSAEGLSEMLSLHDRCTLFAENVTTAFVKGQASFALDSFSSALHIEAQAITTCIKEVRAAQLQRLTNHGPHADPIKVVLLMDLLSVYRRLKEDCLNIGEAIIDERVDAT